MSVEFCCGRRHLVLQGAARVLQGPQIAPAALAHGFGVLSAQLLRFLARSANFLQVASLVGGSALLHPLPFGRQQAKPPECVRSLRSYKALANVERAFRSLKTVDLKVRPIHHRTADRVRSHILLCMLAYYVEWHMREAWRELMFADTEQAAKAARDPVAPAQRSKKALEKVASRMLDDGTPVHSFSTLMAELAGIVRNTCRAPGARDDAPSFDIVTTPNAKQRQALDLIQQISL